MSVPKGSIHTMQSIITNKKNVKQINTQNNIVIKPRAEFNMNTQRFNTMNLEHKKGVSHLAYKEAKKDKVSPTHFRGRWMGFMYRDPNKPRGGCGVCYQH